jgi:tetratricopeptide (TPR) repeat protein
MRAFIAASKSQLSMEQIRRLESAVMMEEVRLAVRRNKDPVEAERLYREVLKFDPANNTAAWYLLYALVNRKECSEAIAVATRFLERPDGRAGDVFARRAWCYLRQNKTADGVADMTRAAELGDIWARKEIARMYWRGEHVQRDAELARHWLQKAAEQGDEEAQREMGRVFGVKIATPPPPGLPRWVWNTLCSVGAAALLVLIFWWEYKEREVAAMDRRLMRYPRSHVFSGVGGMFIFGFAAWIGFWNAYLPLRSGVFLVLAVLTAMCLFIVIERLVVRHELLADGALFRG